MPTEADRSSGVAVPKFWYRATWGLQRIEEHPIDAFCLRLLGAQVPELGQA